MTEREEGYREGYDAGVDATVDKVLSIVSEVAEDKSILDKCAAIHMRIIKNDLKTFVESHDIKGI